MKKCKIHVVLKFAELEMDRSGHLKEGAEKGVSNRPDIVHRCLLTLLDSPLNKNGGLKIFVHTKRNVLIEINSEARLPRTFKRFSGLFAQLLSKMKIKAEGKTLFRLVKNPLEKHLPEGCLMVGLSGRGERVQIGAYAAQNRGPVCFFVGAMAHGEDEFETQNLISISSHGLTASTVCGRICYAYEDALGL
uniref:Nucleolar essential protein 1 n=1 Tax=Metchnikovella dogieli TaxID=2804710 RepID=A0A896WPZ2_9MICR|nr:nucleolar essential protein 1 [Metchnikovella dogieli]